MIASLLVRASTVASLAVVLCALCAAGCEGNVKVKASTDDSNERSENVTTTAPAPAAVQPAPAAAPVTSAPPADACPLVCYEARGSVRAELTPEEVAQLRSALEPVLGPMRTCAADDFRRHGSPMLNLRIAPDGTLADMGVDPEHGREGTCFDNASRSGSASISLPGRKVVRCAERCVRENRVATGRRKRQ